MKWWFGRKAAPADVRPFVPAWLGTAQEQGFARGVEGMTFHVRSSGESAAYRDGAWEFGLFRASGLIIGGEQVVGAQADAINELVGGAQVDSEARAAIGNILAALRQHGLIAS